MRAIRHGALVAVLLGLAAMPSAAGAQTAAVAHRMDAAHSGSTDAGPAPPLRQRWTRALEPEENAHPEVSYPLVAGGRVFIVAARALHALSAQTGETLWSVPSAPGSPAYDAGRVVVTTAAGVKAFDAATGAPLWSRELETHDCPAVASGGVVYTISGWTAHALRLTDGSTLWSRAIPHGCEATVGADLVHYSAGGTTALRRTDGTVAWTSATGGRTAALHGGRLWTGDGSATTAIDATSGAASGGTGSWRMPAFGAGLAFVSAGQGDMDARMLQAVDPTSGAVRWEFGAEHGIHTTPTVAGGTVYVADVRRGLYGLRAGDGALQWCTTMPGFPDRFTHVVAGEGLLVVTAGRSVTVFEPGGAPGCDYRRVARPHWADPIGTATEPYSAPPGVSGYLGGWMHDEITDVDVDPGGAVYVTGWTQSRDFAATGWHEWNAMCESPTCTDAFVAKYAPGGRSLVYRRLMGAGGDDRGVAIEADGSGRAYVTGTSAGRPGGDVFVARLSADGSALDWSLDLGAGDETVYDIALDPAGNAYLTGHTESEDFPTTAGAADRVCTDNELVPRCRDAWVAKLTPAGGLAYSTFFGGSETDEHGTAIAVDGEGRAVIAGIARAASDFPATPGAYDTTPHGSASEAFAARLSAGGSTVEWATTFGGGDWDDPLGMALDVQGRPVVVGATNSPDFPTTPGAQDRVCETGDPDHCESEGDVFATKLAGDGSALVWSTFLGGAGDDVASAVTVGADGDVVIAGKATSASGFPFADAFQTVQRDGPGCASWSFCADAFLVRLSEAGALELGSLLGGDGDDGANGVALDPQGDAWVAGLAHSRNFPVSADAVQPAQSGGNCGGAVLLFLECADGFLTEVRSGTAAPDDPPPPPSAAGPVTAAAATVTAAPSARTLTARRRGRVLTGRLRAGTQECAARVRVVVERRAAGAWRAVARTRTAADGRYRVRLPARRGAYRVRAPGGATCADAAIRPSRAASG